MDVDTLQRSNEQLDAKLAEMQQDLADAKSKVHAAQISDVAKGATIGKLHAELRQHEDDAKAADDDMTIRYGALEEAHTRLNNKHAPLELEVASLRDAITRLSAENEKLARDLATHVGHTEDAEARAAALDKVGKQFKAMHQDIQTRHSEEEARSSQLTEELQKMKVRHENLESELGRRESALATSRKELCEVNAAKRSIETEFHNLANDMTALVGLRAADQERFKVQLAELQAQLALTIEADRRQALQSARDAQHTTALRLRDQKQREEQYITLQEEHAELHLLLKAVQDKMQETAQRHEGERVQFRVQVREHEEALRSKENATVLEKNEVKSKISEAQEEVASLHREMSDRSRRYNEGLARLQEVVQLLRDYAVRLKTEKLDMSKDLRTLQVRFCG